MDKSQRITTLWNINEDESSICVGDGGAYYVRRFVARQKLYYRILQW